VKAADKVSNRRGSDDRKKTKERKRLDMLQVNEFLKESPHAELKRKVENRKE